MTTDSSASIGFERAHTRTRAKGYALPPGLRRLEPLPAVRMTSAKTTVKPPGGPQMKGLKGFRVTLKYDGRSTWVNLWARQRPDLETVLSNLLEAAWHVDQCTTLEEYAEAMGLSLYGAPDHYERCREYFEAQQEASQGLHYLLGEEYADFEVVARTPGLSIQGENKPMRIVPGDAGSALCPPGHPMLKWEVLEGDERNPSLVASLEYALDDPNDTIPAEVKAEVQRLYDEAELVQSDKWERFLYGRFSLMYAPLNGDRRPETAIMRSYDNDPPPPERHLGFLAIRHYFPDAVPRLDLIAHPEEADWWSMPQICVKCNSMIYYRALFDDLVKDESDDVSCIDGAGHEPGGKADFITFDMSDMENPRLKLEPPKGLLDELQARGEL